MRVQRQNIKTKILSDGGSSSLSPIGTFSKSHTSSNSNNFKNLMSKKTRSRVVTIVTPSKKFDHKPGQKRNNYHHKYSKFRKPFFDISNRHHSSSNTPLRSLSQIPNAPHNTTSYLMNFHQDETSSSVDRNWLDLDDEDRNFHCLPYGSFCGSIGDSYEVSSQYSAALQ
jgi:hypothetical protein